jgi:hypothetical protein
MEVQELEEESLREAEDQETAGQDVLDLSGANVRLVDGADIEKRVQQAMAQPRTTLHVDQEISVGAQNVLTKVLAQIDFELSKPEKVRTVDHDGKEVEVPVCDHERVRNLAEAARYLSDIHEFAVTRTRVARVLTRPTLPGKKGKKHGKR